MNTAQHEQSVAVLYQDDGVAENYINERFQTTWGRMLHDRQVAEINKVISRYQPDKILEIAPGPARIATDLKGVKCGTMVEYSEQMIDVARRRLASAGLDSTWELIHGNAFEVDQLGRDFDFLFTFRFIRHFHTEERERLYRAISESLKPDGLLMFDVVNETVRSHLDAKHPQTSGLDVYDVTYSAESFTEEMRQNGFRVLQLTPVMRHFERQCSLGYTLDRRLPPLSRSILGLVEMIPSKNPLEWVALCQKL